jgi:uncharacterized protein (DUF2237 family)
VWGSQHRGGCKADRRIGWQSAYARNEAAARRHNAVHSCSDVRWRTGAHVVCVEVTKEFLAFSKTRGNDLSTPVPEIGFLGLQPGDRWCLCAARWKEALDAGVAPPAVLDQTTGTSAATAPSLMSNIGQNAGFTM